ncbi:hypothetical protein [Pseudoroseomonas ludipueritiae]|uniref:Uncharacterized protein n=1 Tax=Pseudoroseomonas ludipueritiae TaxID=198093 RepID=A0ABR7R209_9PROT|nr:hypothetical protein [Pseudoroseomonas ludipueritiae]MBC9175707.1 hypothetical protein [Pseudoroseomonas ludipueritiae]
MRPQPKVIAFLAALALASPALAQNPPSAQSLDTRPGCGQNNRAEPGTQPQKESGDGTAPGNAGSTGWSGGTGGSYIGTNPAGATGASRTWQPPTARGLDPIGAPKRAAPVC